MHDPGIGWGGKSDPRMNSTEDERLVKKVKWVFGNGYWGLTIEHSRFTIMIAILYAGTTMKNGKPKEK